MMKGDAARRRRGKSADGKLQHDSSTPARFRIQDIGKNVSTRPNQLEESFES